MTDTLKRLPPGCVGIESSVLIALIDIADRMEIAAPSTRVREFINRMRAFVAADDAGKAMIERDTLAFNRLSDAVIEAAVHWYETPEDNDVEGVAAAVALFDACATLKRRGI